MNQLDTPLTLIEFLQKSGMPIDYTSRTNLAYQHGIFNYQGTAAQNSQLLTALQRRVPNNPI